ncbi:MAG: polymer-forming cytoskeletal protein [Bdellovibrionales bacterium]|nr:polymer-forming cytoskeletal protein [Bdellovibrionales bacterium]NQZ17801.1 polymer-forming cytoskeletal protein [Bdellovibrionales bacterium]
MASEQINRDEISVLIEKGCAFEGRLAFSGTARIAGECRGNITSPHVLVIEKGAFVDADIKASEVVIYGEAKGKIEAVEQVHIAAEASFHGDITSPVLHIDEGADFQGHSRKPQNS